VTGFCGILWLDRPYNLTSSSSSLSCSAHYKKYYCHQLSLNKDKTCISEAKNVSAKPLGRQLKFWPYIKAREESTALYFLGIIIEPEFRFASFVILRLQAKI